MARGFERTGNSLYVVCAFCSFLSARPVSSQSATLGANGSIRIGILLPISGEWTGGRTIAGAASLAVEQINRDARLLGGRTVEYTWLDGACNASQSLDAMTELLAGAKLGAIIGPGALPLRLALRAVSPTRA
jgi:ABC-type branched-subunit amino acid transport system substrate-binding protein